MKKLLFIGALSTIVILFFIAASPPSPISITGSNIWTNDSYIIYPLASTNMSVTVSNGVVNSTGYSVNYTNGVSDKLQVLNSADATTNLLVWYGGILVSNIANWHQ